MNFIFIKDYKQGLCSFLDENGHTWEQVSEQVIKLYYNSPEDLFDLGFAFGKFYSTL